MVTLDYYDGRHSKSVICDAEDVPTRDMVYQMMCSDVCGFTVTKVQDLFKVSRLTSVEEQT